MEHEVFVPVEAERLREVLDDPARVARAVPGLQHDAGAEPVTGRLKVRIGGSSITYRGTVRVSARDDGSYAVEGEAAEARGNGTVRLVLRLTPRPEDAGTALVVTGTATADGRVTELPRDAVTSAVTRLLDRFAENLGAAAEETSEPPAPPESPESPEHLGAGDFEPGATTDFETTPDADDPAPPPERASAAPSREDEPTPARDTARDEPASESPDATPGESAAEPPGAAPGDSAPEPPDAAPELLDAGFPAGIDGRPLPGDDGDDGDDSLAEAAHARRTMIGRSAEEVDHAPPRGRYAPVPAPQTVTSPTPLRWAAPAAALAVASAVVAIRALRRRR
ncbi:SRPBCC domain-containing protein [Streptomyces pseudogriseolus]|uniref:SRPBCC family protein n=1 Tax=Streptomyces pseudogriseolus TaxID=36817 RepID=UPI003FA223D1|nr:SRPBCC domain-containing protein [Streptomyces pseudogriseolus]